MASFLESTRQASPLQRHENETGEDAGAHERASPVIRLGTPNPSAEAAVADHLKGNVSGTLGSRIYVRGTFALDSLKELNETSTITLSHILTSP